MSNDQPQRGFDFYWNNTPQFVANEQDPARYLRTFDAMITNHSDDVDYLDNAARSAIAFIAEHAFQAGWKLFKEEVHEPYVDDSISRDKALAAMAAHGDRVKYLISDHFEDHRNPTWASVEVDKLEIPAPTLPEVAQ